ncbi:hypothetical protein AXI59_09790 [Bacillus nakamurai]|uniref:GP-PDE domain-containing protein n=1 Tax=Bacillus nakamurai TaxID=1793963 RepID=A0A150F759_9BACI|nr:glycerophosphodiester phosphodiesterase [Bacillus nakamurai]KXZ18561.1 hypothetical protein AXI58_17295 [Bacillus nakamurai]KXZ23016.1 hypothetical protein AXI59_09790 [Bacillus nakamurai]MCC9023072.1 glycerophosphodiester phosphodiesterase [Bacillus nakamurai]MED1229398.1 glycerophosphodiester phosphodiesterase [Bacillus nakamurai]
MTNIFAHRGASGHYPENTMLAFTKAIEAGADGIELDVQMTKDGRIVVIHDEALDRTTTLKGFVKDTAYEKIRTASAAGKWKDSFKGVRVPLLSDVLRLAEKADFLINIELKNSIFRYEGMEEEVIKKVRFYGLEKRIIFSSFNHESMALCHTLAPDIERAVLTMDVIHQPERYAAAIPASGYHPKLGTPAVSAEAVKHLAKNQVALRPFTVNRPEDMKWLIKAGADAFFTDYPEQAVSVREECGK